MQTLQALRMRPLAMVRLGNMPSVLAVLETLTHAKRWCLRHAQTLNCSSGTCPPIAPPCQCYDVPLNGLGLSCAQTVSAAF